MEPNLGERLPGGVHGAFRTGNIVFKKTDNAKFHIWLCENILNLKIPELRLQEPLRTISGEWSNDGWLSYKYLEGATEKKRLPEKLEVSKAFHLAVKDISLPKEFSTKRKDAWALAERAVWGETDLPRAISNDVADMINPLLKHRATLRGIPQLIHSDLCGNILFHSTLPPALIDLSLMHRPVQFAEAILVYDSIVHEQSSFIDSVEWLATSDNREYLPLACAFRLLVAALLDQKNGTDDFVIEWNMSRILF